MIGVVVRLTRVDGRGIGTRGECGWLVVMYMHGWGSGGTDIHVGYNNVVELLYK